MAARLVVSPRAEPRLEVARRWLEEQPAAGPVLVVGASATAAAEIVREVTRSRGAVFGWERQTLARLAAELAMPALLARELAPGSHLVVEALVATMVHELRAEGGLGRLAAVADQPGLPRALAATLLELRLHAVAPDSLPDEVLRRLFERMAGALEGARIADRALVLELAAAARGAFSGWPMLFVDVPLGCARERDLAAALAEGGGEVLVTAAAGDARSLALWGEALGVEAEALGIDGRGSLARLQAGLFSPALQQQEAALDEGVTVVSAPGESRECVEIARLVRAEAARGLAFDRMAILLRAPESYRMHLEEALRRAGVPMHFGRGSLRPDPAGRSFLALLACAAEGLSARRFAEYMSLGELPDADAEGRPPPPAADRWVVPDDEMVSAALATAAQESDEIEVVATELGEPRAAPVRAGTLRAPRRWEKLLVEAAVIGGRARWRRRLDGLHKALAHRAADSLGDGPEAAMVARDIEDLEALRGYAMPLLEALDALPASARWGEWLEQLSALATRALRRPERVLSVLAELLPMATIGPIDLRQVRLTLEHRLAQLVVRPSERRYGHVFVAPTEAARGMHFEVVFVPGLAERLFPQKVIQDPLLRDEERAAASEALPVNEDRVAAERLALRLAVGSATRRVVLSYPRLDVDQARPRVPSFYGLEVLRAAAGSLPGFDELIERAERGGAARIGWPAPDSPEQAIDEAEYDLALLDDLLQRPEDETEGTARYLLDANPHLGRALRFRARRWRSKWTAADGLVDPGTAARALLDAHRLDARGPRSFSPTALQNFATCPYKFLLYTVHKLAPRRVPEAIEDLDPLSRGSLVHDVQYQLYVELREAGLLPVVDLAEAQRRLEVVLDRVAARYRDELAPAIERVWLDAVSSIRADLREWLRRSAAEESWTPWRFELAFGLKDRGGRDPASQSEPVALDEGVLLRGSIDLVEKKGEASLRATDHKTGRVRAAEGAVVGGGSTLQPALYALALEKIFPEMQVEEGRLYYCTTTGDFSERRFPLDAEARRAAAAVIKTIASAVEAGFLPAAPQPGACRYCDYLSLCGPWEEVRVKRKSIKRIEGLVRLRRMT